MSLQKTPYKAQFTGTRSILIGLISLSWAILLIGLVLAFFYGAAKNIGGSFVLTLLAGLAGAIVIAALSSVFVGVICLIDMRNMAAEKHYIPTRPPQKPARRSPPPAQNRRDPDMDEDNWTR